MQAVQKTSPQRLGHSAKHSVGDCSCSYEAKTIAVEIIGTLTAVHITATGATNEKEILILGIFPTMRLRNKTCNL